MKIEPLFRLRLPNSTILSVAWGDHETVAVGCTDGLYLSSSSVARDCG